MHRTIVLVENPLVRSQFFKILITFSQFPSNNVGYHCSIFYELTVNYPLPIKKTKHLHHIDLRTRLCSLFGNGDFFCFLLRALALCFPIILGTPYFIIGNNHIKYLCILQKTAQNLKITFILIFCQYLRKHLCGILFNPKSYTSVCLSLIHI